MQEEFRFNVFGRLVAVVRTPTGWNAFAVGADGKRGPLGIVVPDFVAEDELGQYLFDIFHESATPGNGDVVPVGDQCSGGATETLSL
ncbi:DUF7661 family protein [Variovorax terrae]|uniref:DUF7661 domain-containing protein n=1 Tax=Variovorax terrae TaxID=2923278 RepID=A0A9X2ALR5_9BURK|nr:hypothetical protein [Variovorax terrae]MCJ0762963.1 hypothetical protein [Variovorax terrae]